METPKSQLISDILLINKIESLRPYNKTSGVMKIDLYTTYEDEGSDALLTILPKESYTFYLDKELFNVDNYSPNLLKIQLIDDGYVLKYTVLDLDSENFVESTVKINESELTTILTLIMHDADRLGSDFDIYDDHNQSFYPFNCDINPNSLLIGRESIWDTLKYLNAL